MVRPAGSADLPLHGGRVPAWLGQRMTRLGAVIVEAIVLEYGRDELLRRLAHPFWFQSFGSVTGMDWHSSGITTNVLGALKRGLTPLSGELGIHVCGGRGKHSRATPGELVAVGERVGLDGAALARSSRLVAKVDSAAVQDGFDLYLHGFIVADDGHWVVVQQGMNGDRRQGAALSLAVRGAGELRRRAACRDRRRGTGRHRQPDRPSRIRIARAAARSARRHRTGRRRARAGSDRRNNGACRENRAADAAAASGAARASRCPPGGRGRAPAALRTRGGSRSRAAGFRRTAVGALKAPLIAVGR